MWLSWTVMSVWSMKCEVQEMIRCCLYSTGEGRERRTKGVDSGRPFSQGLGERKCVKRCGRGYVCIYDMDLLTCNVT